MASHFVTCSANYYWNHKHTASLIISGAFYWALIMAAKNDITGASLVSKANTKEFDAGFAEIDWSVKLNTDEPLCNGCGEVQCKCNDK